MRVFAALLALLVVSTVAINVAPPGADEIEKSFNEFMQTYGRRYESEQEQAHRLSVFSDNYKFIKLHNQSKRSFKLAVNQFADLTNAEFREIYNGYRMSTQRTGELYKPLKNALPSSVDWRAKGFVTAVKDQGQCGSCWAFSTTGSVEGQHFNKTKTLVSLSEQNLVDCSGSQGNEGCNGGLMDQAFQYIIQNKGIDTEASYPYEAEDDTCRFKTSSIGATISSFKDVASGSESDLQNAVANVGPISVAIDASQNSFQFYSSGVYDEPNCSSTELDHGVLAVGYGTLNGVAYWIVKNSWASSWGDSGYILMSRNKNNQCGIATAASFPIV